MKITGQKTLFLFLIAAIMIFAAPMQECFADAADIDVQALLSQVKRKAGPNTLTQKVQTPDGERVLVLNHEDLANNQSLSAYLFVFEVKGDASKLITSYTFDDDFLRWLPSDTVELARKSPDLKLTLDPKAYVIDGQPIAFGVRIYFTIPLAFMMSEQEHLVLFQEGSAAWLEAIGRVMTSSTGGGPKERFQLTAKVEGAQTKTKNVTDLLVTTTMDVFARTDEESDIPSASTAHTWTRRSGVYLPEVKGLLQGDEFFRGVEGCIFRATDGRVGCLFHNLDMGFYQTELTIIPAGGSLDKGQKSHLAGGNGVEQGLLSVFDLHSYEKANQALAAGAFALEDPRVALDGFSVKGNTLIVESGGKKGSVALTPLTGKNATCCKWVPHDQQGHRFGDQLVMPLRMSCDWEPVDKKSQCYDPEYCGDECNDMSVKEVKSITLY